MEGLLNITIDGTLKEKKTLEKLSETGLLTSPEKVIDFNDEPKIPTYICNASVKAKKKYDCKGAFGQGSSLNIEVAKIKAAAEFLERLSIYNPNKKRIVKHQVLAKCINPGLFIHVSHLISDYEKNSRNVSKKDTYSWTPAYDFINRKTVLVPAQVVYISKNFDHERALLHEQITTGAALGNTYKMAFQNGFMEVVERDAFMIAYYNKRRLAKVIGLSEKNDQLVNYLKRYQLETIIFNITGDLNIATFMTIIVDRSRLGPAISVGLKSGFDNEEAIFGSILEAVQPRRYSRLIKGMRSGFKFPSKHEIKSTMDRYYYWYQYKMINHLKFWLKTKSTIEYRKLPKCITSMRDVEKTFREHNYHILCTDITLDEIKTAGFSVVKVLLPELHPLYISEHAKAMYSDHAGTLVQPSGLETHPFA